MPEMNNICLSGLGAIGSLYGGMLHDMDPGCLRVIADRKRIRKYRAEGVTLNGKPYAFRYIEPESEESPADLIIVAVKHHHLRQAMQDMRRFVGKQTVILSLLNGIVSEEILAGEFGPEKILYSFCVGTDAVRQGTHTRYVKPGKIVFGEKTGSAGSPRVEAIRNLFQRAHIEYSVPENIMRELWWKFMLNVGVNQVSAVLGAPYGVFRSVREARDLMRMASREVVLLSGKEGISLSEDDIEDAVRLMGTLSPDSRTSMLQDVEAGRKTEVEIFAGTVIDLGRKHGIATPVNEVLYRAILTLEQMSGVPGT